MASPFSDNPPEYPHPFSSPPAPIFGGVVAADLSPAPTGSSPQLPSPGLSPAPLGSSPAPTGSSPQLPSPALSPAPMGSSPAPTGSSPQLPSPALLPAPTGSSPQLPSPAPSPAPTGSSPQLLSPAPSPIPPLHQSMSVPIRLIVGIVGALIGSLVTAAIIWLIFWIRGRRRLRRGRSYSRHISEGEVEAVSSPVSRTSFSGFILGPRIFTYDELKSATDAFSGRNFLGQGGFGIVHKGSIYNNNNTKSVAIKQLKSGMEKAKRDFQSEAEIISRIHHKHLVSLVGYCVEVHKEIMLVYEYVPNRTVAHHLHGEGTTHVDWGKRKKIAIGSAKGLAYLHEECQFQIIHRDIKADNILLDDEFEPKVADFGLARLLREPSMMTQWRGTIGYIAPEWAMNGNCSEKADIFSFGIVLLELITGRKPVADPEKYPKGSLYEWATTLLPEALENRNFEELADARLEGKYDPGEMFRMVSCAANCVRHSAERRPRMSQVVKALEGVISLDNDLTEDPAAIRQREAHAETLRRMVVGTSGAPVPSDQFHSLKD